MSSGIAGGKDAPQIITNPATKFCIKFINPHNKGGFVVDKWDVDCKYDSADDMKSDLQQKVEDLGYISTQDDFNFGFVIPGHGVKGKQQSIVLDEDVEEMYRQYRGRKEIVLWVKMITAPQKKQKSGTTCRKRLSMPGDDSDEELPSKRAKGSESTSSHKCGSNYGKHLKKMTEVDSIVEDLKTLHDESRKYSPEQIRVWAHMLEMGKHDSYNSPPAKPFFKSAKSKCVQEATQDGISPGKRLNMRTECINQLDKWHSLMERGAITVEQYKEFQDSILGDMKKF